MARLGLKSAPRPALGLVATAVVVTVMVGGCSSGPTASAVGGAGVTPPAPPGDLYTPPNPLPPAPPGTLIWAQRVTQPPLQPPATIWRILYHSQDRTGADLAVSGFAIVPTAPTQGGRPRRVYAWAHGSQGQGDQCAPSRQIRNNLPPYGGQQAEGGAVIVATDYEGLGTPGEPTYLVGSAEGHAVLDSVRAAAHLPGVGALGPVVIAGESQGGGGALWAGQLARTYAPELDVRGVVALAPAAEFTTILRAIDAPPFNAYLGNLLLAVDGLHAGYGQMFDPAQVLTPAALADLGTVSGECIDATIARWRGRPLAALIAHDPATIPPLAEILDANGPGAADPGVPIFLGQGDRDQQIPVQVSAQLEDRYCKLGAKVVRHVYPGVDHDGVADAATADVLSWIGARYAGRPAVDGC